MTKNIFVLGLLDWQRDELRTIENSDQYSFISLLSHEELVLERRSFDELLGRCRAQIEAFNGKPHAVVCHWDFPSSCLAPILAGEYGLRTPSLESVLKCEHKYWSRLEQQRAVPECTPRFQSLDPFDPNAAEGLWLDYPIWLKPVKGFSSMLGFKINNRGELDDALAVMREQIGEIGEPFDECLRHGDVPDEVRAIGGHNALAEEMMSGLQFAPEGHVQDGDVHIHAIFDMPLERGGNDILGLRYPADLPEGLEARAKDAACRIVKHVGFDDGCFNVEFLYDDARDKLWLIEVNTRISQSHCELFRRVDGMSNHEIAVSVALGREPHLRRGKGPDRVAAKLSISKAGDAEVVRVPDEAELRHISKTYGAEIHLGIQKGDRLSELPNQPVYAFHVADVFLGGDTADKLMERYHHIVETLPVAFSDAGRLKA